MPRQGFSPQELVAREFELHQLRADQILTHLGKRTPPLPDAKLRELLHVQKFAAAAVIASPHDVYHRKPEDVPLGMQIRKIVGRDGGSTQNTLECPGGAFQTDQELVWIEQQPNMTPLTAPSNLFYQLLYAALMDGKTDAGFTYNRDDEQWQRLLKNVRLELEQEMSTEAAQLVRICRKLSTDPYRTDLTTVSFNTDDDKERDARIVEKYREQFGLLLGTTKKGTEVQNFIQRVDEHVMWGDVDDVEAVAKTTKPTAEARGSYVYTTGELLDLFEKATAGDAIEEQANSWQNFIEKHPGLLRPRAPSTALQLRLLFSYVAKQKQTLRSRRAQRAERIEGR